MIMKLHDEARGDLVAWLDGPGGVEAFRDFGIVFAVRYDAGWFSVPWGKPIDESYAAAFDAMAFESCVPFPEESKR